MLTADDPDVLPVNAVIGTSLGIVPNLQLVVGEVCRLFPFMADRTPEPYLWVSRVHKDTRRQLTLMVEAAGDCLSRVSVELFLAKTSLLKLTYWDSR